MCDVTIDMNEPEFRVDVAKSRLFKAKHLLSKFSGLCKQQTKCRCSLHIHENHKRCDVFTFVKCL